MPITPRHLVGFMFDSHFAADFGKKNYGNIGFFILVNSELKKSTRATFGLCNRMDSFSDPVDLPDVVFRV